jgi:hypothetical protein
MREAYLELLKLCLCDLAGGRTISVGRMQDGSVLSRELVGDELRLRAAGMDWPLQGLTMVGLNRLDDLQSCVEAVVGDGVEGDLIEAGAWRGGASILIRATLDSLGADDRTVWVADSFQGFPAGDAEDFPEDRALDDLGPFDFLAVPLEEVADNFARFGCDRGVRFLPGFFEDTMRDTFARRWSIIRIDVDTYETTLLALRSLYPGLSKGGYLIVDDYGALEECRLAVDEFRERNGIAEPLEQVDWTCVRWRRESESQVEALGDLEAEAGASKPEPARALARPRHSRVPTMHELELEEAIASLRSRVAAAEAEVQSPHASRFRRMGGWLRDRLRRSR